MKMRCLTIFGSLFLLKTVTGIYVPGVDSNKTTLTTFGLIKELGWQHEENTTHVETFENYSRVYVHEGGVSSSAQNTELPSENGAGPNSVALEGRFGIIRKPQNGTRKQHPPPPPFQTSQSQLEHADSESQETNVEQGLSQFEQELLNNRNKLTTLPPSSVIPLSTKPTLQESSTTTTFWDRIRQQQQENVLEELSNENQSPEETTPRAESSTKPNFWRGHQRSTTETVQGQSSNNRWNRIHNQKIDGSDESTNLLEASSGGSHQFPPTVDKVPKPTKVQVYSKCPKDATGYFVYSITCNQFLNCWKGRGVVQNCAPGTLFNPESLECDHAHKVNCVSGPRLSNFEEERSLANQKIQISCPPGFSGVIPHYNNCAKFINCVNGQEVITDCPPGTLFNLNINNCDFPYNSECATWTTQYGEENSIGDYVKNTSSREKYTESHSHQTLREEFENYQDHNHWGQHFGDNANTENSNFDIDDYFRQYVKNFSAHSSEEIQETHSNYGISNLETSYCPKGVYEIYPFPEDCSKYLSCNNGALFIYDCEPGTAYDPVSMGCDLWENVNCNGRGELSKPRLPEEGPRGHYVTYPNPPGRSYTSHDYHQTQAITTPRTQKQEVKCPKFASGLYPHPIDCSKFLNCDHGRTFIQDCGPGTVFNPNILGCDFPYNVECDKKSETIIEFTDIPEVTHVSEPPVTRHDKNQGGGSKVTVKPKPPPFPSPSTSSTTDYPTVPPEAETNNFRTKPTNKPKNRLCESSDFFCGDGSCIPYAMVCDSVRDCVNGMDEARCEEYISKFSLKASSKLAVREKERYNNQSLHNCAKSCLEEKSFHCKSFSYRKEDGMCLLSDLNVGLSGALKPAKPYDYYELSQFSIDCKNLFKCPNQKCIDISQVCDGLNDCGDRIDEKGCPAGSLDYSIRLKGSDKEHEGRVEIKVFGKWGQICDDSFGLRDADVVCKEVGFALGAVEVRGNSFYTLDMDERDVFYMMDDVSCLGNETSLRDCDFNGWGVHNCELQEVVGVVCKTPQETCPKDYWQCDTGQECLPLAFVCDGVFDCEDQSDEGIQNCEAPIEIRLANGSSKFDGRVEIRYHGTWGTVCDDDFNDDAAKVVCHYLGFQGSANAIKDGVYGPGTGPIWLDQVYCQGNETSLDSCMHWNWGEHNCEHAEDVGVVCSNFDNSGSERNLVIEPHNLPQLEVFPDRCGFRRDDIFTENDDVHFRVVKGSIAKQGEYPWQASIRIKTKAAPTHWCGAVVISRKFVLTAAHCLVGFAKGSYVVVAGDYDVDLPEGTEETYFIEEFYIHEQFRGGGHRMNNDIALIKLKGEGMTFTKDIQAICLPDAETIYEPGLNCTISGFGSIQSGVSGASHLLRAGWIPLQSRAVCQMPHVYGASITDGMICAGSLDEGIDACDGDSGGPLACLHDGLYTLYGVTSWGQHCGYANKPGVYVKISHYRQWIEDTIKKNIS